MSKLEINDILSCPLCDLEMVKCLKVPERYEADYCKSFEMINFKRDAYPECPKCTRIRWLVEDPVFKIHVKGKGWVLV